MYNVHLLFVFFQAEDGIRDRDVTGVQTCALPIFLLLTSRISSGHIWGNRNCSRRAAAWSATNRTALSSVGIRIDFRPIFLPSSSKTSTDFPAFPLSTLHTNLPLQYREKNPGVCESQATRWTGMPKRPRLRRMPRAP